MRRRSTLLLALAAVALAAAAPAARAQGRDEKYTVTIAPDFLQVAGGTAIRFEAALFHRGDRKFLPQAWEWSCDGGAFNDGHETIFAQNTWIAPLRPGNYAIKVTQKRGRENGAWGIATVEVLPPARVVVERVCRHFMRLPCAEVTLHPGESFRFQIQACGCHRGEPYVWRCEGGTLEDGFFVAGGRPGAYVLEVTDPCLGVKAMCTVHVVVDPVLTRIALDPPRAECAPDVPVELHAIAYDQGGRPIPATGLSLSWAVSAGGAVDDDGCFVAPAPGRYAVRCREQRSGLEATAEVIVRALCRRVSVQPAQVEIGPGERVQLVATAFDPANRPLAGCAIEWRAALAEGAVQTAAGGGAARVEPDGTFCADGPLGTYRVVARERSSGCEGFAEVVVRAACERIALEPSRFECAPGETVRLRAVALDHGGRPLPRCEVLWQAEGGTIDAQGCFTAGAQAGRFRIVARERWSACECAAEAVIRGAVRIVNIAPRVVVLRPGERCRFAATAYDDRNQPLAAPIAFAAEAGAVAPDGWFTAPWTAGRHIRVTVTDPRSGATDWADVYVTQ
jgi:plastocyanin